MKDLTRGERQGGRVPFRPTSIRDISSQYLIPLQEIYISRFHYAYITFSNYKESFPAYFKYVRDEFSFSCLRSFSLARASLDLRAIASSDEWGGVGRSGADWAVRRGEVVRVGRRLASRLVSARLCAQSCEPRFVSSPLRLGVPSRSQYFLQFHWFRVVRRSRASIKRARDYFTS